MPSKEEQSTMTDINEVCTLSVNGTSYTARGAVVTDTQLVAYLHADTIRDATTHQPRPSPFRGTVTNWNHTIVLGRYRVISSWPTPRSFTTDRMYAVHVTLSDGRLYSGRSGGSGMIVHARRVKSFSPHPTYTKDSP